MTELDRFPTELSSIWNVRMAGGWLCDGGLDDDMVGLERA
ncbi:hypothetical protein D187_008098 [Cystobacter fuscus DSM 2262]|uniref:Uncharacterized protein n=1 Tax=Cystobacter fuscus (strain ATCC 25194 / DSM 2262 / NBRC 100088 / M29) TaxID=1242864 RepID=S9P0W7_CYSF2|nr:hypothetical protein D187_008098 [Cystobacter fuscus DSM 2262]